MDNVVSEIRLRPALQQPDWPDADRLEDVRRTLSGRRALVRYEDVQDLRQILARVARGEAQVVQAGDCAEDPMESSAGYVARKAAVLDLLAGAMKMASHKPIVRIGRIAGQFAKPRSQPVERIGGVELPVYRGHMVNSPEPAPKGRVPDPSRLLTGYDAAGEMMGHLGWHPGPREETRAIDPPVWTSHEALLLDYELPMLRRDGSGALWLASTHLPWIGERTRALDGAHVELFAAIANPVACKVGPSMAVADLLTLCERLDPLREPGRLTLISRMGAYVVGERLPALVAAVRAAGHPVSWLCDPMHGNTVTTGEGLKTRYLEHVEREVRGFLAAVRSADGTPGGIHLETTPDDVTECVRNETRAHQVGEKYTSFCDPRLTASQAVSVIAAWRD
ncbi:MULTISPECIES: 3-deoxy-7-phosphoheptulonate synthase [unclassified Streptomyces]|uniref:3-deoxy-7-phosphoheptulonate synthase n=1 Tax=unclassified Streptomyces TaxID=2593676 RepID=UPI003450F8C0